MNLVFKVALLLVSTFVCGQATITIEVDWELWSSENRVTFRNPSDFQIGNQICYPTACFVGGVNTPYTNQGSPEIYLSVPYGTNYDLLLEDQYGDGWNGTSYVRVYQDGMLILDTDLTGGFSTTVPFDILPPSPVLSIDDVAINEDAGPAVFTITHSGGATVGPFTVDYTTLNGSATAGSDYVATSGTLNFNGQVGDTEQITVSLTPDANHEADETYTVRFTSVSDGSVDITDIGLGTIINDDNDPNSTRPYQERFTKNLKGDFIMRGNTNLQCVSGCPVGPTTNNPTVNMGYIDVDSDPSTINSSSNTLTIPSGATVAWAGLYWGGVYASSIGGITNPPPTVNIDQVKFRVPGASGYTSVNAQVRNIETTSAPGWNTFMSFSDVTSMVRSGGNGTYFVADIALATGSAYTGPHGGWNLVIVYEDLTNTTRNIAIWDGFQFFGFGSNDNFTVTGLLTPASGSFQTHAGYYGMDGEADRNGDFVSINGAPLFNVLNPSDNTLNGTISEYGIDVGGRNPNFVYSWGLDIDLFDASGLVPNGATSLDVQLGSANEGIWGGVFAVSNEIAFPAVSSKTFSPATLVEGDESTVTVVVDNPARGVPLTNFSLTDNLPEGMFIGTIPNPSSSCGGIITAIPGSDSFNVSGLTIPAGSSCTFTFDVSTSGIGTYTNTIYPNDTTNDQGIPFEGESSGSLTVNVGNTLTNRRITYRVKKTD